MEIEGLLLMVELKSRWESWLVCCGQGYMFPSAFHKISFTWMVCFFGSSWKDCHMQHFILLSPEWVKNLLKPVENLLAAENILSAQCIICNKHLPHHSLFFPCFFYEYNDLSLVKGMYLISFSSTSCIFNNFRPI